MMPPRQKFTFASTMLLLLALFAGGCSTSVDTTPAQLDLIVAGSGGDGPWHDGLRSALAESGHTTRTFAWGAPLPLYMLNLQTPSIHHDAEAKLAHILGTFRQQHPDGQINLIAHSAGCGVALGALQRLPAGMRVNHVILLAPSLSPTYDLAPALAHLEPPLHVFHSDRDNLWLSWRTRTFGTYDNVKTEAAGHTGFVLPPAIAPQVQQHPYDPAWSALGNDGDHYGPLARPFAAQVLLPLLN